MPPDLVVTGKRGWEWGYGIVRGALWRWKGIEGPPFRLGNRKRGHKGVLSRFVENKV